MSVAQGDAERTLDNFHLAERGQRRNGRTYLRLRNGKVLHGVLRGATPTHVLLVWLDLPITRVKGPLP